MQTYKELRDPTIFYHPKFGTSYVYVLDQRLSDNNKYIPMLIFGKVKPGSHLSQESGMASSGRCDSADCIPIATPLQKRSNVCPLFLVCSIFIHIRQREKIPNACDKWEGLL